jgi:hypothetical protein
MIAPRWQYLYHAMSPSMLKEWLIFTSVIYSPDSEFQERLSVIEILDSSPNHERNLLSDWSHPEHVHSLSSLY